MAVPLPIRNSAVHDLYGGQRVDHTGQKFDIGWCIARQVPADHKGHFGLHLGLHQARYGSFLAIEEFHVIQQHTEIRLVHTELLLHGLRCESDLGPVMRRPCCRRSFVFLSATAYAASSSVMLYVDEIGGMARRLVRAWAKAVAACSMDSLMGVDIRGPLG